MMPQQPPEVAAFYGLCRNLTAELLTEPAAHAVAYAARLALQAQAAQLAGLAMELDRYQGRTVYHTTDARLEEAAAQVAPAARPGEYVRATDTGRELCYRGHGEWVPV